MGWEPKSALFRLNFVFAQLVLFLLAVGIALGLWRAFFARRRPALDPRAGELQRHSAGTIAMHWLNAIGFILALASGAMILRWVDSWFDKATLYLLHYVGAALILIGFVAVGVNAKVYGGRHTRIIPRGADIRDAIVELIAYLGLVGDRGLLGFPFPRWPAPVRRRIERALGVPSGGAHAGGKYLPTEHTLSYPLWAIVGLALIATGVVKAVRYVYSVPGSFIEWMTTLHDWAAIATVFIFAAHVAAVVLVRTNWPLLRSMFTGRVPADYARERHARWYHEEVAEAEAASAREQVQPARLTSRNAP